MIDDEIISNVIVIFPLEILFLEINYEILNLKIQKNEKQSRYLPEMVKELSLEEDYKL